MNLDRLWGNKGRGNEERQQQRSLRKRGEPGRPLEKAPFKTQDVVERMSDYELLAPEVLFEFAVEN